MRSLRSPQLASVRHDLPDVKNGNERLRRMTTVQRDRVRSITFIIIVLGTSIAFMSKEDRILDALEACAARCHPADLDVNRERDVKRQFEYRARDH